MRRRLTSAEQLAGWRAQLAKGYAAAVVELRRSLGARLRDHGRSWSDPASKTPAALWSDAAWADAVDKHLRPAAEKVAAAMQKAARAHFNDSALWGSTDRVAAYASGIVSRALDGGALIAERLAAPSPEGLVAAGGNISRIRDLLDDAAGELATIVERSANAAASDASIDVASDVADATGSVVLKAWYCSFLPTSRPEHEDADGQTVALDEPFDIDGDMLMYPGDPDGPEYATVNCQCWTEIVGESDFFDVSASPAAGGNEQAISDALDSAVAELG